MKGNILYLIVLAVLLMGFGAVARGDLTPEQTKEAQALIQRFSAREFAVRQKAVEELIEMGPEVLPLIRRTLAETKDNEVKLRCEMVIKGIPKRLPPGRMLGERVIKDLGPPVRGVLVQYIYRTPNGEGVAYRVRLGKRQWVVHNGKKGKEYDHVKTPLILSPDGRHLTYIARNAGKMFIVRDDVEGPRYAWIEASSLSPDGKRFAYTTRRFIVCDGRERRSYMHVSSPRFSPDSRHLAYDAVRREGRTLTRFIVIDGLESVPHKAIWATKAEDKLRAVVLDGNDVSVIEIDWPNVGDKRPGKLSERRVRSLGKLPDPDGKGDRFPPRGILAENWENMVLHVRGIGRERVIFNGESRGPYDSIGRLWLSPGGKRFFCTARRGKKHFVVWNGKAREVDAPPGWLAYSPKRDHIAYCLKRDGKVFVCHDDKEGAPYDYASGMRFSSDAKHFAYVARRRDEYFVVLDGVELAKHELAYSIRFSPNGKHLVYTAKRYETLSVMCNGRKGPEYDKIRGATFSPDGRHLCYAASRGGDWFMVVDGIEGPPHTEVNIYWTRSAGAWNAERFRYLVLDGNREKLIEANWPKDLDWTHGLKPVEP